MVGVGRNKTQHTVVVVLIAQVGQQYKCRADAAQQHIAAQYSTVSITLFNTMSIMKVLFLALAFLASAFAATTPVSRAHTQQLRLFVVMQTVKGSRPYLVFRYYWSVKLPFATSSAIYILLAKSLPLPCCPSLFSCASQSYATHNV